MPCSVAYGGMGSCPLEFKEWQLEDRYRCHLHAQPQQTNHKPSRAAVIQAALDDRFKYFIEKNKPLILHAAAIPPGVTFSGRDLPELQFYEVAFIGADVFRGARFDKPVSFTQCSFPGGADFTNAVFLASLYLMATVRENATFKDARIEGKTTLILTADKTLPSWNFDGINCAEALTLALGNPRETDFSMDSARVDGLLQLKGQFGGRMSINGCTFAGGVQIEGRNNGEMALSGIRSFRTFNANSWYFAGPVTCDGTQFDESALFTDIAFDSTVSFKHCTFKSVANFYANAPGAESKRFRQIDFSGAKFMGPADFKNRLFASTTNFRGCTFAVAPEFHGATLHQDTRFPSIEAFLDTSTDDAQAAYRTLRQAMESNNARREEAMFYTLEQRTLRNLEGAQGKWENFASAFYDFVSVYGMSSLRPLYWLGGFLLGFGLIYALWASLPIRAGSAFDSQILGDGLTFSLQQIVNPFYVWRDDLPTWSGSHANWLRWIATIQSLVTTGFFALFLLALRWRFKRD